MKGVVLKSTGSWYTVVTGERRRYECRIRGSFRLKGIKSTNPVAVGDHVTIEPEGADNAVITGVDERKNYIIRKSTNLSKQTHIIAANIDQAFLVATLVMPRTSTGFIDRFLVTAEAYCIPANIIFNKADLYDDELNDYLDDLVATYELSGYKCYVVSAFNESDVQTLRELMKDKVNLVAGHSGVGKSTLINAIEPNLHLKVGNISEVHSKGKHTTTFAEMFELSNGGFIIDTPGIKEFGLVDIDKQELGHYFPEIREKMSECQFNNCLHMNEPKCAVRAAVEEGLIAESRYENYIKMLNSEEMDVEDYD
jgi:ribosome biogenesis GTPase / thiamine phosphate phosphatase